MSWSHTGPALLASFLASLVECVEALTVVLAVGSTRDWRSALFGSGSAVLVLLALVALLGRLLTRVPLQALQLVVGMLLLLFGLRWLRKAVLRAAGRIPLHDETAAFQKNANTFGRLTPPTSGWDRIAFAAAFQIVLLEGAEVVFIVVAIAAGGAGLLLPASAGALAALLVVVALGAVLHRPLGSVPENELKLAVGIVLSAFGTFWVGEGSQVPWPGGDWSILVLIAGYAAAAAFAIALSRGAAVRGHSARGVSG